MSNTWFYLSAVIAGVIVGMGLGWWALFRASAAAASTVHVHAWKAREVQYPVGGLNFLFGTPAADQFTRTLYRCECNKPRVEDIKGRWTLGQITGNSDDDVVDATIVDVEYPYTDGDHMILGPECFTNSVGDVISYRGDNFYRAGFAPDDQHGS